MNEILAILIQILELGSHNKAIPGLMYTGSKKVMSLSIQCIDFLLFLKIFLKMNWFYAARKLGTPVRYSD